MNTSLQSNQEGEENQPPDGRPKTISSQRGIFSLKAKKRKKIDDVLGPRIIRSSSGKSKVCTGRGCRDRRVRLAPKTAIQFYDVQERLGFDRPSKAIDWLMAEAKAAIDALQPPPAASQPPEVNNNSEFQVYSDIPDDSFEWIYENSPPPVLGNNHNIHDEFSPREPLQSSFSRISNYNPIGIEDFAPGENPEIDNIHFSSASFLQYEE